MIIFGVDCSLTKTGYALLWKNSDRIILLTSGLIKTDPKDPIELRLNDIYSGLWDALLSQPAPDVMCVEESMFSGAGVAAAIKQGCARGVVYLMASESNIPLFRYAPTTMKKQVAGSGRAKKPDVQKAIQKILKLKSPQQEDEADATAAALCYLAKECGDVF